MSKDKYPRIFSPQMDTIVFIILQIFYATHAVLKIGGNSRIIFGLVKCLDQSQRKYLMDYNLRYILKISIIAAPIVSLIIYLQIRKGEDIIITPVLYQCTCQYKTYFLGILFAYKGVLLLFGLFLAWETRNVRIPALNDSRYIGMSVYNVAVLSIVGAIVVFAMDGSVHYEALYAISSLCLIVCTSVTLLLVFVPKVRIYSS